MSSVWRQTLAAVECCSVAKRTVVPTLTDRSLTYTHIYRQSVCCSGRGDTCVTVKLQNICLGNLWTAAHICTDTLVYPELPPFGHFWSQTSSLKSFCWFHIPVSWSTCSLVVDPLHVSLQLCYDLKPKSSQSNRLGPTVDVPVWLA